MDPKGDFISSHRRVKLSFGSLAFLRHLDRGLGDPKTRRMLRTKATKGRELIVTSEYFNQ